MPYTPKKYNKIQLVAYHTPTFLGSDVSNPPPVAPLPQAIKSLMNADERSRAARMYLVAMWAATHKNVDRNDGTLKVFLAPEFYFKTTGQAGTAMGGGTRRSAGKYGAYSFNTMQNIMECLRAIFTAPAGNPNLLKHWLMIPGTIVSDLPADGKTYSAGDNYYLNTAVIIKGEKDGPFHYIQKYMVSAIDGPPVGNGVYSSNTSPYLKTIRKLADEGLDSFDDRVFTIDHIKFALEVCLDHAQGIVKQTQPGGFVDIHLVTACGMRLTPKNIVAKSGGYAMICDGVKNNIFPRSDVRKIVTRSGQGAMLDSAKWDCIEDKGCDPKNPTRKAPPKLIGGVRGLAAVPKDLQVKPLSSATMFRDGNPTAVPPQYIKEFMFPEEIVWYEPVSLS